MEFENAEWMEKILSREEDMLQKISTSIEELSRRYGIQKEDLLRISEEGRNFIDAGIFQKRAPLGAICTELKAKGYSTKEIAKKLGRSYKTIWTTIKKTERKKPAEKTGILIPLRAFENRNMGILESAVKFLKDEKNMRLSQIAKILKRNYRTVWTAYNKAKEKE
ncbi:MAG: helix-turn-helix domain-containing protein [Candidatus Woesearchaeota archaeon]